MLFLFATILFLSTFTNAAPINRVIVYDNYTVTTSNDIMGCITGALNTSNLILTLFPASSGNFVFCITDETGFASANPIDIMGVGGDVFYPDGIMTQFQVARDSATACFYSNGVNGFHQRRF